jgi:chaperonin GroES
MVESSSGSALLPSGAGRWPVNLAAVPTQVRSPEAGELGTKVANKHEGRLSITRVENGSLRLTPLGDNLVVRCLSGAEQTVALPVMGEDETEPPSRERPLIGRVLSIGDGRLAADGSRVAPRFQEGDRVLYLRSTGTEIDVDGEELLILSEDDILMRLP